jgi:hypothetical protein
MVVVAWAAEWATWICKNYPFNLFLFWKDDFLMQ